MKKIILAIFLSLSVITFSSTSKNTEKEKELIKAKIEFFIGIIKTPYLYSYLAAKLNTTKNDDSFLSKENNEKIIEFFTNHIKNNKYIIKDIDCSGQGKL